MLLPFSDTIFAGLTRVTRWMAVKQIHPLSELKVEAKVGAIDVGSIFELMSLTIADFQLATLGKFSKLHVLHAGMLVLHGAMLALEFPRM